MNKTISGNRRSFLKKTISITTYMAASIGCLLIPVLSRADWNTHKFSKNKFSDVLSHLFGDQTFTKTKKIKLKLPRIAENGAVVPLTVSSSLKNISSISILVENNPVPLIAQFNLTERTDAFVSARLKMAETSDVIVVIKTNDALYTAHRKVEVTIGGCG